MSFKPIRKLDVFRILTTGDKVKVGTLAQDRQNSYFAYDSDYLANFANLSPFKLKFDTQLQLAPKQPNFNLHGVFADSLPDGWGLLLQDRYFRQQGILPHPLTLLARLAFVGDRGIGGLVIEPNYEWDDKFSQDIDLAELGLQAQSVFDGQTDEVLQALVVVGSSGGARPKAQIFSPSVEHLTHCRTLPQAGIYAR